MNDKQVFINRRNKLINTLTSGILVIPNSDELIRNQDTVFQYRFDSYFYYLTGFNEPESVLIIDVDNKKSILFCRDKNHEREMWDGFRYGVEGSKEKFSFDETYSIKEFSNKINGYLINRKNLYYTLGYMPKYDQIIVNGLANLRKLSRSGSDYPSVIIDINQIIAEMRLFKDDYDIKLLTKACEISSIAHIEAMKNVKKAVYEYEIEAKIFEVFYKNGARNLAYTPIVAGGKNACVLHYVENNQKLNPSELLLVDAGCEYLGYAADITRTYPINGKFSRAQQAIYEIVLEANKKAIEKVKCGTFWNEPGEVALKIIIQGLIDLNLLKGNVEDNINNGDYKRFYMHKIGHWLGLDVHDVGKYKIDGSWRKFEMGMCTTIEPGIYISPNNNISEEYWNIGIRIEDDILLTENGNINLTDLAPKEINDLETIINN